MLLKIRKVVMIAIVVIGFVATIMLAFDGRGIEALIMAGLTLTYLYIFK
jgi:hypothetical protein